MGTYLNEGLPLKFETADFKPIPLPSTYILRIAESLAVHHHLPTFLYITFKPGQSLQPLSHPLASDKLPSSDTEPRFPNNDRYGQFRPSSPTFLLPRCRSV